MEKIKCPLCKTTLLFAEYGSIEKKCEHCKAIVTVVGSKGNFTVTATPKEKKSA